jgi:[acyl-carrier-protein] S-malonyltransferase
MSHVATVAGNPVSVREVDEREALLRAGPRAASLPRPHTSEGRQLRRWLTQVLVTERVIAAEAAARGLTAEGAPVQDDVLPDTTARLEIGSVTAAALADPLARAVYADITRATDISDEAVADYQSRNPGRFSSAAEVADHLRNAAKRRAFRIWVDATCAELVELATGYEHPGDPRQPDNTHRH